MKMLLSKKGNKRYADNVHSASLLLAYKTVPDVQPSGSLGFWLVPNSHLVSFQWSPFSWI